MSSFVASPYVGLPPAIGNQKTTTMVNFVMDSAASFLVSGDVALVTFVAPANTTLVSSYLFCRTKTGSPGDLNSELYGNNTSLYIPTGFPLQDGVLAAASISSTTWLKTTYGTPAALTKYERYWLLWGLASGDGSNNISIATTAPWQSVLSAQTVSLFGPSQDTAGGVTPSVSAGPAVCVLKFGDGSVIGFPYTTITSDTNNALKRGFLISPPHGGLVIGGALFTASSAITGIEVFSGNAAPNTTPIASRTFVAGTGIVGAAAFDPITIPDDNTDYRVVLTYSGNSTSPGYINGLDFSTHADVMAAAYMSGKVKHTISTAPGTGWTDSADKLPQMALLLSGIGDSGGFGGGTIRAGQLRRVA